MIGYFDCFSGVAGDMIIGAMLDAGLPFNHLKNELKKLHLHGYDLARKIEQRGVIGGINFQVNAKSHEHSHSHFSEIVRLIKNSHLSKNVKDVSCAIFETLAKAEAHVHRTKVNDVHFHEVGAIDSIVDIVGSAIGLDYFKFNAVYSSPLPITRGWVKCQHGKIPVPVPATLEILKGVSIIPSPVKDEIVTPTGAAILKTVVKEFGANPIREIKKIGYGHGDKNFKEIPNSLRLIIGEGEPLVVVEANIDDMNPQIYEYLIEELMKNGAIDVTITPALMKKKRPGNQIQVLCEGSPREKLIKIILKETTSIGVRYYPVSRSILNREIKIVKTKYGTVRVKIASLDGKILNVNPEYEDCKKIARAKRVPFKEVYNQVLKSF